MDECSRILYIWDATDMRRIIDVLVLGVRWMEVEDIQDAVE